MFDFLKDAMYDAGVFEYGVISPADIEYRQMIRDICEDGASRRHGTTWSSPPAIGALDECRERALQYDKMLVFTAVTLLEDSFDYEGMIDGMSEFKQIALRLESLVEPHVGAHLVLSNDSCEECEDCTYPDAPCRFPSKLHHSVEGYGILVNELAERSGLKYNNGPDTVTYFGAVLFDSSDFKDEA